MFQRTLNISIHAPAWGATPRHCGSRLHRCISIHAPAWGATDEPWNGGFCKRISIHAPAWGATLVHSLCTILSTDFNPRARVGRDPHPARLSSIRSYFNPRARVGRDNAHHTSNRNAAIFQSTRPRGARQSNLSLLQRTLRISIHAPAWGATELTEAETLQWEFQSTRPRGARQNECLDQKAPSEISIHAPAWGATGRGASSSGSGRISIHAPAWGATRRRERLPYASLISIHAPAWGATEYKPEMVFTDGISIHAPAWGATVTGTSRTAASMYFNPRARVGRDFARSNCRKALWQFQSTRPRGARLSIERSMRVKR